MRTSQSARPSLPGREEAFRGLDCLTSARPPSTAPNAPALALHSHVPAPSSTAHAGDVEPPSGTEPKVRPPEPRYKYSSGMKPTAGRQTAPAGRGRALAQAGGRGSAYT